MEKLFPHPSAFSAIPALTDYSQRRDRRDTQRAAEKSRKIRQYMFGLGILTVSLSGSVGDSLSKPTSSLATTFASYCEKPDQTTPAREELVPTSFLASPLDLERLTNKADLIIIGRVKSVSRGGRPIATLSIDKVVKGGTDTTTVDVQFFPNLPSAYMRVQPEQFGMFFLKWNESGSGYQILDPTYPAVIAPADAVVTGEPGLDRIVDIVGQVLRTARTAEDRRMAVSVLRSALTDRATELLRQAVRDKDVIVKMQTISALLNRDDIETLAIAERVLLTPPPGTEPYLLDNISAALEGIKDPQAIPTLQRLLGSSNTRTRLGAVMALRQMKIMETVEGLVIALGDNSRDVRYIAVIALAELTGHSQFAPSKETFEKDEQRYLDHWKRPIVLRTNSNQ